jgi:hypothetical protein
MGILGLAGSLELAAPSARIAVSGFFLRRELDCYPSLADIGFLLLGSIASIGYMPMGPCALHLK